LVVISTALNKEYPFGSGFPSSKFDFGFWLQFTNSLENYYRPRNLHKLQPGDSCGMKAVGAELCSEMSLIRVLLVFQRAGCSEELPKKFAYMN